jgi:hypothetical protein
VKDYGLPTYTFIELFDDHPGSNCGSSQTQATCIKWNDQSMNLIVEDIMNGTSPYRNNTAIAISEDDTQDGQNGVDHINDGRRFPFVMVAPHNVMKSGAASGSSCGISVSPCGLVIHQTFNTSNVLAVMERVEMNVNPSSFALGAPTGNKNTFPMVQNDYLAEGNPLEPLWKCGEPGVPCNTGVGTQTLTKVTVSPSTVTTAPGGSTPLTGTAYDQNNNVINAATFAWNVAPTTLGSVSPATGSAVTFTAGSSAGTGRVCTNATYPSTGGKTMMACAPVTVSTTLVLTAVAIEPPGPITMGQNASTNLTANATGTGGAILTGLSTFKWDVNNKPLAYLNKSTGPVVKLSTNGTLGTFNVCVNGTYGATTLYGCDAMTISKATPILTSVTLVPSTITIATGGTRTFYAQAYDQYGAPYNTNVNYQWRLSPSTLGSVTPTNGSSNTTVFTASTTGGGLSGSLLLSASSGAPLASNSASIAITNSTTSVLQSVSLSPTSGSVNTGGSQAFTATPTCSASCAGTTYTWALSNPALGGINSTTSNPVQFTAGSSPGTLSLWVNATLNSVMKTDHVLITITQNSVLTGVAVSPTSTQIKVGTQQVFTATLQCSSSCPGGATYSWSETNSALGSLSSLTTATTTFTAGLNAGTLSLWLNVTLNSVTKTAGPITVQITTTQPNPLASVSVSPMTSSLGYTQTQTFSASLTCTGGACPAGATYAWSQTNLAMGTLNSTTSNPVLFTAGSTSGSDALFLNVTLGTITKPVGPISITITGSSSTSLNSVSISPTSASLQTGNSGTFMATPSCTPGACPEGVTYVWSLSSMLGNISSTTASSTVFTAGNSPGSVVLTVTAELGTQQVTNQVTIVVTSSSPTQQNNGFLGLSTTTWVILVIVIVAAAVLVAVLLTRRKKGPSEPEMQPWGQTPAQQPAGQYQYQGPPPDQAPPPDVSPPGPG